jgi:hypothetical protein
MDISGQTQQFAVGGASAVKKRAACDECSNCSPARISMDKLLTCLLQEQRSSNAPANNPSAPDARGKV